MGNWRSLSVLIGLERGYTRGDRKYPVLFQNTFFKKSKTLFVRKNMYHRIHMEAKGHLSEMSSLLLPHASCGLNSSP